MREHMRFAIFAFILVALVCVPGYSQQGMRDSEGSDSGTFGAGVKVSLLGAGAEAAVRVSHRSNIRAGFNAIMYDRGFDKDGIAYRGQLDFKTFEAHYDYFPWARSFHVSPGVLIYAADPITGTTTAIRRIRSVDMERSRSIAPLR